LFGPEGWGKLWNAAVGEKPSMKFTLSFMNFMDGNILLTERTHTIRFTHSRNARA